VARVLVVGAGPRGESLATALGEEGHVVRGPVPGDPAAVVGALEAVAVLCWLGGARDLARLRMVLEKLVDTTVRGLAYEPAGAGDRAAVEAAHRTWAIPVVWIVEGSAQWPEPALRAVRALLDSDAGKRL
jgi:hypothetical protein